MRQASFSGVAEGRAAWQIPQTPRPLGYGLAIAGVGVTTWLLTALLRHTHVGNVSLIYLLLVLVLAVFAGSGPAIVAALLAFFALDWFFVPPVGHLVATGLDGWLALCLFLVVAVLTGQLTAGFRNRADMAQRHAQALSALYELSVAILGDAPLEDILRRISVRLTESVGVRAAALWLAPSGGALELAAEAGPPPDAPTLAAWEAGACRALAVAVDQAARPGAAPAGKRAPAAAMGVPSALAVPHARFVPIMLGGRPLGVLGVSEEPRDGAGGAGHDRLLHAFAAQAAFAIGRARLAEEEERARQTAASERMKSVFLASVSHDLRTPLTAIRTAAAGLREALGPRYTPPLPELTDSIDQEAARLNRLVENLLEMSRIEADGLPPRKAPEDLAEIIGAVVHRLRPLFHGRTLSLHVPEELPLVPLDAIQIDRVLANLFENAAKFSPATSVIALRVWAADDRLLLRMSNEGPALSAFDRAHAFEKFYRRATTTETAKGTGLGLAICKGIIEAHGGVIYAEDRDDGVGFVFSLPLAPASAAAPAAAVGGRA